MKKIILSLTIILGLLLAVSTNVCASVYGDGDGNFITDGKVHVPTEYEHPEWLHTYYYASGNIEREVFMPGSVHYYLDETFYAELNKGRVYRIDAITTYAHTPHYEFDYHGDTDSVKEMNYFYLYGTMVDVYKYNKRGDITSLDKYASSDRELLYEHRKYSYKYHRRSGKVKEAKRTIVEYAPHWEGGNITREETNRRYYYRNQNIKREITIERTYEDVNGEARLRSVTRTIDTYSRRGVLRRQDYRYREYNPETGEIERYEHERTFYNRGGTKTVRSNFRNWETTASSYYGNGTTEYDVHGNIVSSAHFSTSIHGENIVTFEQSYTNIYTYDGDEITSTVYSYFASQTENGVLNSTYSTESTRNEDFYKKVSTVRQYASDGTTLTAEYLFYDYTDYKTGVHTSRSIIEKPEYYPSGNLKSRRVHGDDNGYPSTTYTYYDDDFYGNGVGRLKSERTYGAPSPHAFRGAFNYTYWGDTDTIKIKEHFYGPVGRDTYEYFESGNLEKYTEGWAGFTLKTLTYADIDYDGDGIGRILEETQGDHTGITVRFVYRNHYDGSEQYRYKDEYDADDNLIATYEYDESGDIVGRADFENPQTTDPPDEVVEDATIPGDQEVLARLAVAEESAAKRRNTSKLTFYKDLKAKKSKYLDWLKN